MNIRRIYEYALQREHEGKEFFETNAGRMSHAAAADVFLRLAAEEQKHIDYIEHLIGALDPTPSTESAAPELAGHSMFAARAESEMLDETVIQSMIPDVTVLRTAYVIERDFAEFYEMAAGRAEGAAQEALIKLARWERGHERLFKDLHDRVFEQYAEMPWGG